MASAVTEQQAPPSATSAGVRRSSAGRQALQTIGFALATLLVISIVTFWATARSPQEAAINALGREVTQGQIDAFIEEENLDEPVYERYLTWLGDFVQGDWGTSAASGQPVREDIMPRLTRTLILAFSALLISIPIALAIGIFMARRAGRWQDMTLLVGTTVVTALPEFVIAIVLLSIFSVGLGWFPVDSSAIVFGTTSQKIETYVLPVTALVLVCVPYTVRIGRAAIRETLAADYTRAAVLRGLPRRTVVREYAVRNAAVPILNTLALNLVYMISGVVVIENVFGMPGIGQRMVEAVLRGETETVQAIAMVMGALIIVTTVVADLLAIYFNPKLRAR